MARRNPPRKVSYFERFRARLYRLGMAPIIGRDREMLWDRRRNFLLGSQG